MKVLHLILHRQWFEAIARGEKTIEYRAATPYWERRLAKGPFDEIHFRNGYNLNRPWLRIALVKIERGEWDGQPAFLLHLGKIVEIQNWSAESASLNLT